MGRRAPDTPAGSRSTAGAPDVVIWEADGTVDGRIGYGAAIAWWLDAAGWTVRIVPLPKRSPTDEELDAPVHVLSGGSTAVTDDVLWLDATRRSLDRLLDRALGGSASVTGICFGAQLLASRLAGPAAVGPHPGGIQAGLAEVDGTGEQGVGHVVSSFHYHHIDRRALEAAGGRVTLTSRTTAVQAFEVGSSVRGVQFHPELAPDALDVTLRCNRAVVERHGSTLRAAATSVSAGRDRWDDGPMRSYVVEPARRRLTGIASEQPVAEAA